MCLKTPAGRWARSFSPELTLASHGIALLDWSEEQIEVCRDVSRARPRRGREHDESAASIDGRGDAGGAPFVHRRTADTCDATGRPVEEVHVGQQIRVGPRVRATSRRARLDANDCMTTCRPSAEIAGRPLAALAAAPVDVADKPDRALRHIVDVDVTLPVAVAGCRRGLGDEREEASIGTERRGIAAAGVRAWVEASTH